MIDTPFSYLKKFNKLINTAYIQFSISTIIKKPTKKSENNLRANACLR